MKTITIHERPPMEYPIYKVLINNIPYFIQRMDCMNSGSEWYEMVKETKPARWVPKGGYETSLPIGFTKNEAIQYLKEKYSNLKTNIMKTKIGNKTEQTTKSTKSVKKSKSDKENQPEPTSKAPVKKVIPQNSKKAEKLIKKSEVEEKVITPKPSKIKETTPKPVKTIKQEKKSEEPKSVFTRTMAMATVLKDNPNDNDKTAIKSADQLYTDRTGKTSNLKEQAFVCRYVRQAMSIFFPK